MERGAKMSRRVSKTSIRKVPFENEYQVKAYDQQGVRFPSADYFASSFEDAFETAKLMIKTEPSSEKEKEKKMKETPKYFPEGSYHPYVANSGDCYYIAFSIRGISFSVFLTDADFLELQIGMEKAKKDRYEALVKESTGISIPSEEDLKSE
jgi:hypothetical protein